MNKRTLIGIGAILTATALVWLYRLVAIDSGSSPEPPSPETLVEVKVTRPVAVSDTLVFEAQGRVTARKSFAVTALSEGRIREVYVAVGQPVRKGQAVALLENRELDRELAIQNDKLQLSRRTVEDMEKKARTAEEMLALGIVSENDLIALKQELNTRKTEQNDQEITIDRLKERKSNYRILSDTEGYISEVVPEQTFVTYGQAVAAIISLEDEQVEAFVPFDQLSQPAPGDEVRITCGGLTVSGMVAHSFPSVNSNLIRVIVAPAKPIPMNLEVKVTFKAGALQGLLIPKSAVVMDEGKPVVYVVRDGTAYKNNIDVAKDYLDKVVISGGLTADDLIVSENAYLLSDRMNVAVK